MMSLEVAAKRFATECLPEWLQVRLTRWHYLRMVARVSEASESYFSIVRELVSPGDAVMDVGANMGEYSKYMSDLVGDTGMVVAVEPLPRNLALLRHVSKRLGLDNVLILGVAASAGDGTAELSIPREESGVENYYQPSLERGNGVRSVRVETRTIDSLRAETGRPLAFIKIDVEGHEWPCVQGAMKTLSTEQPALLIEVSGDPDLAESSAAALFAALGQCGYQPFAWVDHKVRARIPGERQGDYFFLTSPHVRSLGEKGLVVS